MEKINNPESNLSTLNNCMVLLNHQNIPINQFFINLKSYNFNNEKIDINKVENINIENIKFKLSQQLREYFYIFQNDYIIFDFSTFKIYGVITQDYNKFNNLSFNSLEDHKILFVDNQEIQIYYNSLFSLNSYYKSIKNNVDIQNNNDQIFIFYQESILIYPPTFYKTFKLNNNLNNIKLDIGDEFNNLIIDVLKNNKIKNKDELTIDKYFYISLNLNNLAFIKQITNIIKKDLLIQLFKKYIFYIIKVSDHDILKYLNDTINKNNFSILSHQQPIKLNVLNSKGLNPFEYSIMKFKKDNEYYKFIEILKDYDYERPKYILDIIFKSNLIKHEFKTNYDNLIFNKIKNISKFENITIINSIILKCMYSDLNSENNTITIQDIINFISTNKQFINLSILYDIIYKNSSILVLKELLINKILIFDSDIFKLLINMKQSDYLYNTYKTEIYKLSDKIIYDFIEDLNIYGIVFLINYINPKIIYLKDKNNNNLLHYLANQNKDIENKEDKQFKIFKFLIELNDNLIIEVNNDLETPIFNTIKNKNVYLFNLNIEMDINCVKIKNKNGCYVIHEIIKHNFLDGLYSYIKNKCSVEYLDLYNNNGLMLAIKNKNEKIANILLENKTNTKIKDINNNSIFHFIGLYGLKKINIKEIKDNQNNNNIGVVNCIKNNIYFNWNKYNK
mgnify:CR=1 FL=1